MVAQICVQISVVSGRVPPCEDGKRFINFVVGTTTNQTWIN